MFHIEGILCLVIRCAFVFRGNDVTGNENDQEGKKLLPRHITHISSYSILACNE